MPVPWNDATKDMLTEQYKEFGQWARHYSAVRLTLGTFVVTSTVAILYFLRDKSLPWWVTAIEIFICGLGVLIFIFFSKATFDTMIDQLEIVNSFRDSHRPTPLPANYPANIDLTKYDWKRMWDGWPVAIGYLLFYIVAVVWVMPTVQQQSKSDPATEIKLPVLLQSGTSAPVTLEVPIRASIRQAETRQ